jgi:single-strand DNA-binding protein
MSLNHVVLVGRVGKDAELVEVGSTVKAVFSLATSEHWKDKDGNKKEATEWHTVEVWGKQAEAIHRWIEKGRELCVTGKINTNKWEKDGKTQYRVVIRASEVSFVGAKAEPKKEEGRRERGGREETPTPAMDDMDDDIPF